MVFDFVFIYNSTHIREIKNGSGSSGGFDFRIVGMMIVTGVVFLFLYVFITFKPCINPLTYTFQKAKLHNLILCCINIVNIFFTKKIIFKFQVRECTVKY
jgi:hypothetical protein